MFKSVRFLAIAVLAGAGMFAFTDNASAGILFHRHQNCCPTQCCATPTCGTPCCQAPCQTCSPCSTCGNAYTGRRARRGGCNACCAAPAPCSTCGPVVASSMVPPMAAPVTPAGATAPAPMAPAPVVAAPCGTCGGCAAAPAPCCDTGHHRHRLFGRRHANECCN